MANYSWPAISISASSGPIQFTKNAATVTVTQDTSTPANSIALPMINLNTAGNETGTASVPFRVDPTGSTTQPVSAVSLPLPTGAATSAKQPALGTAGSASVDVLTVQGIASMTALKVDGSAVTQPVSASSLPLPTGAATSVNQLAPLGSVAAGTAATNSMLQGVLYNSTLPTLTTGQQSAMQADSSGRVLVSPQNMLNANVSPPTILNNPSSNSMAALNANVVFQVEGGNPYYLTLTSAPGATTTWVGTVTFQTSPDNSVWTSVNALPSTLPGAGAVAASTSTANGLWTVEVPITHNYVRAIATAYTSGTIYALLTSYGQPNASVVLPWNYTVTSGQTLMSAIDTAGFSEISIQLSAVTTTVLTAQGSNDTTGTTWQTIPVQDNTSAANALTISATGTWRFSTSSYKWIRLQCTSTGTVLTVQGVVGRLGFNTGINALGNSIAVTSGVITSVTTTSTNNTTYSAVDQASAAITTTTTGAAKTIPAGTSLSMMIAVTAVSGTAPTYDFSLQESADGTNWTTIYQAPRITATGFFQVPAIRINTLNYRYVETIGGTTPSFTRVLTSNRTAQSVGAYKNLIDRTINPVTTNSTSASLFCEGCSTYSMIVNQGAGGSAVVFALDGSDDNANWVTLTSVLGIIGGATPVTCVPQSGQFRYIRARVVTGVASTTITYLTLIASNNPISKGTVRGFANAPVRNDYTGVNVTTASYVQLVAATTSNVSEIEVFDSSGQTLVLAIGAAGVEQNQINITPGGNGRVPLWIPAGLRLSIKAVSATASVGELDINFYS